MSQKTDLPTLCQVPEDRLTYTVSCPRIPTYLHCVKSQKTDLPTLCHVPEDRRTYTVSCPRRSIYLHCVMSQKTDLPALCHVPEDSNCPCGKWVSVDLRANGGRNKEQLCATSHTRCTALPEKPTVAQLVYKFHAFYVKRRFITALTTAASCACPEPERANPCPFLKINFDSSFPSTLRSFMFFYRYICVYVCLLCVCFCVCVCVVCVCMCMSVCVCVCVCVYSRTFPSRLCSSPGMIQLQVECCKQVNMSAVDVISILIPQVIVNSSQPQRDFQFQISHVSVSDISQTEGV